MASNSRAASCRTALAITPEAAVGAPPPPDLPVPDFAAGSFLHLEGKYQLVRLIGSGAFGSVYEAMDVQLGRSVAIKIPDGEHGERSLMREAQALSVVNYPGLVQVHCLGSMNGTPYLVMELLRGTLLADLLFKRDELDRGPMPTLEVLEIVLALAETLVVIHDSGFAHRDIKAENIMLVPRRVVLVDLGLAMPEYEAGPGSPISGTPEYIAPELVGGQLVRGQAYLTDIYALGVLAFRLLAGSYPFESKDGPLATLMLHIVEERPCLASLRPELPTELTRLVSQMLALSPEDRPASAEAVGWALRPLIALETLPASKRTPKS